MLCIKQSDQIYKKQLTKMVTNVSAILLLAAVFGSAIWTGAEGRSQGKCCEEYCYSNDREQPQNLMFASKTAYEFIKANANDQDHQIPHCTAIQFWMISRHGTRLPTTNEINHLPKLIKIRNEILSNYDNRRTAPDQGRLCYEDLENLRKWQWNSNITTNHEQYLVRQGYDDLKFLAKRYQSKYPNLLMPPYTQSTFHFRFTDAERSQRSAEAFADGLFAPSPVNLPPPQTDDTLLKPFAYCPRWQNQSFHDEYNKFKNSEIFKQMLDDVSTRLGFKYTVDELDVETMWDMCRYDKAWEVAEVSPWCAVFTIEQVKILEYKEDLKHYYRSGYGNQFNREVGCGVLKDMLDLFNATIHGQPGPRVTAYFGQSTMLSLLRTTLGLAEDAQPLRADDFYKNSKRKWRMSKIDAFANNVAAILYKCDASQGAQHQVLIFDNEGPADLKDCRLGLCAWDTVIQRYGTTVDKCSDIKDRCAGSAAASIAASLTIMISFLLYAM